MIIIINKNSAGDAGSLKVLSNATSYYFTFSPLDD